jgi:hypothetical protein
VQRPEGLVLKPKKKDVSPERIMRESPGSVPRNNKDTSDGFVFPTKDTSSVEPEARSTKKKRNRVEIDDEGDVDEPLLDQYENEEDQVWAKNQVESHPTIGTFAPTV